MVTIGESAKAYEPSQMKNVADLEIVRVDAEIKTEKRKNKDDEDYTVSYIKLNDEEYRVPSSVLEQLKGILEAKPTLKTFKVVKSGRGMATKYQVIPID